MNIPIAALLLMSFAYMGALPLIFFRRDGNLNLKWWLTAFPFFGSALLVAFHGVGLLQPWYPPSLATAVHLSVVALSALSIGLISYTLGTHRRPLALWHQRNDAPESIVTEGAYKRIRHPFYASFIAMLIASAAFCGSPLAAALSLAGILMLNNTAANEERRLLQSPFGDQYRAYVARTGRFIPSFR